MIGRLRSGWERLSMRKGFADAQVLVDIGHCLKAVRLERGMSQEALARTAEVSPPTVRRRQSLGQATVANLIRLLRQLDRLDGRQTLLPAPQTETPSKTPSPRHVYLARPLARRACGWPTILSCIESHGIGATMMSSTKRKRWLYKNGTRAISSHLR
ncbi:hypothetical protein B0E48_15675 [Rhodanobacter sp. C03]|nr:hypothetical protein B0E48_15675 [Rhodanobacter sp. C03]